MANAGALVRAGTRGQECDPVFSNHQSGTALNTKMAVVRSFGGIAGSVRVCLNILR
jgi:hypothetical protein